MAVRRRKPAEEVAVAPRRGGPANFGEEKEDVPILEIFGTSGRPLAVDITSAYEPDPREVDSMTDRIFGSVLSRYGWEVHNGHAEYVGEEKRRRQR